MTHEVHIPEPALDWQFTLSSGPGGQNVNKTATAVVLRVDISKLGLTRAVESRLIQLAGSRLTKDGVLLLRSERSRSQSANREDALERLKELLRSAQTPIKARVATRVSRSQKKKRVDLKKRHSAKKRDRKGTDW